MYLNICPECGITRKMGDPNLPTIERMEVCPNCDQTVFHRFRKYEKFKETAALEAVTSGAPLSLSLTKGKDISPKDNQRWQRNIEKARRTEERNQNKKPLDLVVIDWVWFLLFCYGVYWAVEHFWGWSTIAANIAAWWATRPQG